METRLPSSRPDGCFCYSTVNPSVDSLLKGGIVSAADVSVTPTATVFRTEVLVIDAGIRSWEPLTQWALEATRLGSTRIIRIKKESEKFTVLVEVAPPRTVYSTVGGNSQREIHAAKFDWILIR